MSLGEKIIKEYEELEARRTPEEIKRSARIEKLRHKPNDHYKSIFPRPHIWLFDKIFGDMLAEWLVYRLRFDSRFSGIVRRR